MNIVRAIDLGYGNVKYTTRNHHSDDPPIVSRQFPSLAVPTIVPDLQFEIGAVRRTQTIGVIVQKTMFQVGPDSPTLLSGQSGRVLDPQYCLTDRYDALMRGALAYVGERKIDVLVLGLPISTYAARKALLVAKYAGDIVIPDFGDCAKSQLVSIKRIIVLPQPMGGFFDARLSHGFADNGPGTTLVIDPGFFTVDWLVVNKMAFVATRSNSLHGGVSRILRQIADRIEQEISQKIADLSALDAALRGDLQLYVHGHVIDLAAYSSIVDAACEGACDEMLSRLGDIGDVQRVILCGGGAELFRDAVAKAFPRREFIVAPDAGAANVRGFQFFGEQVASAAINKAS